MDDAGHRKAVLGLEVVDRVTVGERSTRLLHLLEPAGNMAFSVPASSFLAGNMTRFRATRGLPPMA